MVRKIVKNTNPAPKLILNMIQSMKPELKRRDRYLGLTKGNMKLTHEIMFSNNEIKYWKCTGVIDWSVMSMHWGGGNEKPAPKDKTQTETETEIRLNQPKWFSHSARKNIKPKPKTQTKLLGFSLRFQFNYPIESLLRPN